MTTEEIQKYLRSLSNNEFGALLSLVSLDMPQQEVEGVLFLLKDDVLQAKTQFLDDNQYQRGLYLTNKGAEIIEYLKDCKNNKLKT